MVITCRLDYCKHKILTALNGFFSNVNISTVFLEKSSSQLVELLILSPNVSKLACGLKMAYMSDELYPYLENKACSLVWIIFASRKLMLDRLPKKII